MITHPSFFQNELLRFVIKNVKNRSVAEDIVHDVFIKVQDKSIQLKNRDKEIGWIYKITRNAIIDYYRSQSRVIDNSELDWNNEVQLLNQCVEQCLEEKLAALPEKYREAIILSEMQGVSQLDLAKSLNISYSGAKSRVQRARQMLKEMMERDYHVQFDNYGNVIRCENRVCDCP